MYDDVMCILCNSKEFSLFANDHSFQDNGLHKEAIQCKKCGLIIMYPPVTEDKLKNYYDKVFHVEKTYDPDRKKNNEFLEPGWGNSYTARYINRFFKQPGVLLDVGCGRGLLGSAMEKTGWEIFGCDLSPKAVNYARNIMELPNIYLGELEDMGFSKEMFDLIIFSHSLEHMFDPINTLKMASDLLKQNGKIFIEVPNVNRTSYLLKRILFRLNGKIPPLPVESDHTFEFGIKTINSLLEKSGFISIRHRSWYPPDYGKLKFNNIPVSLIKKVILYLNKLSLSQGGFLWTIGAKDT